MGNRPYVALAILVLLLVATSAGAACSEELLPFMVTATLDSTGEIIGQHIQFGWFTVCSGGGGGGDTFAPLPGGGASSGSSPDAALIFQHDQYKQNLCQQPDYGAFIDQGQYEANPLYGINWATYSGGTNEYVIVDDSLRDGWLCFVNALDNQVPAQINSAYRSIQDNLDLKNRGLPADTCGDHSYGKAIDVGIRGLGDSLSCTTWTLMAAAAKACDAWVEPWVSAPNHLHMTFNPSLPHRLPGNNPGTCTGP